MSDAEKNGTALFPSHVGSFVNKSTRLTKELKN